MNNKGFISLQLKQAPTGGNVRDIIKQNVDLSALFQRFRKPVVFTSIHALAYYFANTLGGTANELRVLGGWITPKIKQTNVAVTATFVDGMTGGNQDMVPVNDVAFFMDKTPWIGRIEAMPKFDVTIVHSGIPALSSYTLVCKLLIGYEMD